MKGRYFQAKATKCGEKVDEKSEHPDVPMNMGNSAEGTHGREGDVEHWNCCWETLWGYKAPRTC
jgi:hypothetical protein